VSNYRGREVFLGLGVVWLVWAGCAIIGGIFGRSLAGPESVLPLLTLAGPLALVGFALGLVDDAYGTGAERGFRGHLRALAGGRLTTGGMKLLGVSVASYVAALVLGGAAEPTEAPGLRLLVALPVGAAIALTANFVNLTDLRPGRALKVYGALALVGVLSVSLGLSGLITGSESTRAVDALALLMFAAGPIVATWRYDLGERGMMGDAGANAAGAVAGLLIVAGLPLGAVLVYLAVMLALNLASERISFSRIIERSSLLSRIDAWGRLAGGTDASHENSFESQGTDPK
jgi:hypothetical protein